MKLITYLWNGQVAPGALVNGLVMNLDRACRTTMVNPGRPDEPADTPGRVPTDLLGVLKGGEMSTSLRRLM